MSESGSPGRYQRTSNGLVASLLVTVLVIVGFVLVRNLITEDFEDTPENIDYLSTVRTLQDADVPVVYPPELPEGWIARAVRVDPGERPAFELSMLTDDEKYVGLHQEDADVDDLLARYVDENPEEGDVLQVTGSVASRWQSWSDAGGDHAFTAEVGDDTVMVFGSAPVADIETILRSLTDATLPAETQTRSPGEGTATPQSPSS